MAAQGLSRTVAGRQIAKMHRPDSGCSIAIQAPILSPRSPVRAVGDRRSLRETERRHGGRGFGHRSGSGGSAADCRRCGSADLPAHGPRIDPRLSRCRPGDWPVRPAHFFGSRGHSPCRRTRRGDVPVHHRAGDAAVSALEPAARNLRAGRAPGRRLRFAPDQRRLFHRISRQRFLRGRAQASC